MPCQSAKSGEVGVPLRSGAVLLASNVKLETGANLCWILDLVQSFGSIAETINARTMLGIGEACCFSSGMSVCLQITIAIQENASMIRNSYTGLTWQRDGLVEGQGEENTGQISKSPRTFLWLRSPGSGLGRPLDYSDLSGVPLRPLDCLTCCARLVLPAPLSDRHDPPSKKIPIPILSNRTKYVYQHGASTIKTVQPFRQPLYRMTCHCVVKQPAGAYAL